MHIASYGVITVSYIYNHISYYILKGVSYIQNIPSNVLRSYKCDTVITPKPR